MNSLIHGFTDLEEGQMVISANLDTEKNKLQLIYTDNGKGIKPSIADKIFEPFFTTNKGKGSSGLGMYIVKNAVENTLEGTMVFTSEPNQGVNFIIEFPINIP